MDPNANWEEQQYLKAEIKAYANAGGEYVSYVRASRARLRELQAALREWIARGGFPPDKARLGNPVTKRSNGNVRQRGLKARSNWRIATPDEEEIWFDLYDEGKSYMPALSEARAAHRIVTKNETPFAVAYNPETGLAIGFDESGRARAINVNDELAHLRGAPMIESFGVRGGKLYHKGMLHSPPPNPHPLRRAPSRSRR